MSSCCNWVERQVGLEEETEAVDLREGGQLDGDLGRKWEEGTMAMPHPVKGGQATREQRHRQRLIPGRNVQIPHVLAPSRKHLDHHERCMTLGRFLLL